MSANVTVAGDADMYVNADDIIYYTPGLQAELDLFCVGKHYLNFSTRYRFPYEPLMSLPT